MERRRYPTLYQLPARPFLYEQGLRGLDAIPDGFLDSLAARGFDMLYLLGAWTLGAASLACDFRPERQRVYRELLPDLQPADVIGSPFAVAAYVANPALGTDAALLGLKRRLNQRGMRLVLDFVPNHGSLECAAACPELFLRGPFGSATDQHPSGVFFGRDRYHIWGDTAQFDFTRPDTRAARGLDLFKVASLCDGVRCDMAMLQLPDVHRSIWGTEIPDFWRDAISALRRTYRDFVFLAEAYWDTEDALVERGFDFVYCKRPLDTCGALQDCFAQGLRCGPACCHFLENHDEARIARFHNALPAAVQCYLRPGLRFFQHGQLEGRRGRLGVQLRRAVPEAADPAVQEFYAGLLRLLRDNAFQGAFTQADVHRYVFCGLWTGAARRIVLANLSDHALQVALAPGWLQGAVRQLLGHPAPPMDGTVPLGPFAFAVYAVE
ncbi:Alpha amylase catalytic region [Spironucleus salmonicida]|uniref:Alpha amylase catalytic region n=1 Tax=Spironucleus salmonicida TaxID=348837 RepID=V6LM77_9EUKA|nr:Alpha amylase catalytic region [Spironucleus salmonicida]KAH0573194.1 Alpha amylase catalytic region [Spironucleus salmonicida]|eukprot:EST41814.1 Alpha amylase catalytic region [Spironucleus salmonicida]